VAIVFTLVEIFNNRVTHSEVGKFPYFWQGDHVETIPMVIGEKAPAQSGPFV
jgi:hypothetical protein